MATLKFIFLFLITALALISCGGTTKNLSSGQFSNSEKYKINSYAGCCGCRAEYVNIYNGKIKLEQIIYKYNCYKAGMPTKFIFNYDDKGNLVYCDLYIATTTNDFEQVISKNEKQIFDFLDRDKVLTIDNKTIKYSEITGFRKPKENEVAHKFPLFKGGSRVTVK